MAAGGDWTLSHTINKETDLTIGWNLVVRSLGEAKDLSVLFNNIKSYTVVFSNPAPVCTEEGLRDVLPDDYKDYFGEYDHGDYTTFDDAVFGERRSDYTTTLSIDPKLLQHLCTPNFIKSRPEGGWIIQLSSVFFQRHLSACWPRIETDVTVMLVFNSSLREHFECTLASKEYRFDDLDPFHPPPEVSKRAVLEMTTQIQLHRDAELVNIPMLQYHTTHVRLSGLKTLCRNVFHFDTKWCWIQVASISDGSALDEKKVTVSVQHSGSLKMCKTFPDRLLASEGGWYKATPLEDKESKESKGDFYDMVYRPRVSKVKDRTDCNLLGMNTVVDTPLEEQIVVETGSGVEWLHYEVVIHEVRSHTMLCRRENIAQLSNHNMLTEFSTVKPLLDQDIKSLQFKMYPRYIRE